MGTFWQTRTGGSRVTRAPNEGAPGQGIYEQSSVPQAKVGEELVVGDRAFKYALNGAVALDPGKMCQGAAPVANHLNCAVAAAAGAGSNTVTVTLGATALSANAYAEGWLHVNDVNGEGQCYRIKSHPSALSAGTVVVTLYDEIVTALTTSSEVTLTANLYSGVVIAPNTGLTSAAVGVPLIPVTAAHYFWIQTKGVAAVLTQGTVVIGQKVGLGGTADGACGPVASDVTDTWGRVVRVNASTDYSLIDLKL